MLVAVTSTISSEAMLEMPVEAFMNRSPSLIRLVSHSRPPESSSRSNLGVPLNEVHSQTLIESPSLGVYEEARDNLMVPFIVSLLTPLILVPPVLAVVAHDLIAIL